MKLNILGTKYDLKYIDNPDEDMQNNDADGYTDSINKKIVILSNTPNDIESILRHEIIHAYLIESGIGYGYAFHNEDMVEWLAMQFPKIEKTINNI